MGVRAYAKLGFMMVIGLAARLGVTRDISPQLGGVLAFVKSS